MDKKKRPINFAAGPAKLPEEVLLKVQEEMMDFQQTGMSVIEISHRSSHFMKLVEETERLVRELLGVPDNYRILLLSGGATGQFAGIPLNLLTTGEADYAVTGTWSSKAAKEAAKYGKVNLVFPKPKRFVDIPDESTWCLSSNASYLYYCDNETIDGVEYDFRPEADVPIVCDMSSNIFTRPVDVSKYGLIYAGSQKNFSCPGVTLVIVREDLVGKPSVTCPAIWEYKLQDANQSLYNTPNTFSIYVMKLMLQWMKDRGGVAAMSELSDAKSKAIYDAINDSNGFYSCPVKPRFRSRVNIPFRAGGNGGDEDVEKRFLKAARDIDLVELKGHRSVGGLRASLYNAMSLDETVELAKFMQEFARQ